MAEVIEMVEETTEEVIETEGEGKMNIIKNVGKKVWNNKGKVVAIGVGVVAAIAGACFLLKKGSDDVMNEIPEEDYDYDVVDDVTSANPTED